MARSFMFLGTASTSVEFTDTIRKWLMFAFFHDLCLHRRKRVRTSLRHLDKEQLLAFFWFSDMCWDKWILYINDTWWAVNTCHVHECCRYERLADEMGKPRTMKVSKLGLHHWARQSPISQSLSTPWDALNCRESAGGARRSSSRFFNPSISSSPGLR